MEIQLQVAEEQKGIYGLCQLSCEISWAAHRVKAIVANNQVSGFGTAHLCMTLNVVTGLPRELLSRPHSPTLSRRVRRVRRVRGGAGQRPALSWPRVSLGKGLGQCCSARSFTDGELGCFLGGSTV